MPIQSNDEILAAAIEGLETRKDAIDAQITRLRQMMVGESSNGATTETTRGRRTMSPAARKRIAEAQRARWAALKGTGDSTPAATAAKKTKRRLSPEGRRRIIEATKKRWAAIRKAQAKASK